MTHQQKLTVRDKESLMKSVPSITIINIARQNFPIFYVALMVSNVCLCLLQNDAAGGAGGGAGG